MRCLVVVKFATKELTTAKYGCSDKERGAEPHTACCTMCGKNYTNNLIMAIPAITAQITFSTPGWYAFFLNDI